MQAWLWFLKADSGTFKAGECSAVKTHAPFGGDADFYDSKPLEVVSLEAAEDQYLPVSDGTKRFPRYKLSGADVVAASEYKTQLLSAKNLIDQENTDTLAKAEIIGKSGEVDQRLSALSGYLDTQTKAM